MPALPNFRNLGVSRVPLFSQIWGIRYVRTRSFQARPLGMRKGKREMRKRESEGEGRRRGREQEDLTVSMTSRMTPLVCAWNDKCYTTTSGGGWGVDLSAKVIRFAKCRIITLILMNYVDNRH